MCPCGAAPLSEPEAAPHCAHGVHITQRCGNCETSGGSGFDRPAPPPPPEPSDAEEKLERLAYEIAGCTDNNGEMYDLHGAKAILRAFEARTRQDERERAARIKGAAEEMADVLTFLFLGADEPLVEKALARWAEAIRGGGK